VPRIPGLKILFGTDGAGMHGHNAITAVRRVVFVMKGGVVYKNDSRTAVP
jgi:hypothetical protein